MIEDANAIDDKTRFQVDLCIVGAGAAGVAIALQLAGGGRSVLLLESGGLKDDPATQALYEGETADEKRHSPPDRYRVRRFGGSTTLWGGRCIPFDPIDFEARPYMPHSGWPIPYQAVAAYYPQASTFLEAGAFAYTAEEAFPQGMRPLLEGFASSIVSTDTIERFSRPTDVGSTYAGRLAAAPNLRVLLNANCTHLRASPDGNRIEGLTARTLGGKQFEVTAGQVVLSAGGLEVPRLLLNSNDVQTRGLGNAGDLVGRYYMCHTAGTLGRLTLKGPLSSVWHGYDISPDGVYCRRQLTLSEAAQRQHGIGNFLARLHHPRITDATHRSGPLSALYLILPLIRYEYAKRFEEEAPRSWGLWWRHAMNVLRDPVDTARFFTHLATKRVLAKRKFPSVVVRPRSNHMALEFHGEQQPNPDSRITLSNATDALGLRRLRIDWRHTGLDIETVRVAYELMAQEFANSGRATLDFDRDGVEHAVLHDGAYGGHHIGATRMSATPATGVVDGDCRVHGLANLYIASASVFPTSSRANPTLTIVALALRLAEHLKGL